MLEMAYVCIFFLAIVGALIDLSFMSFHRATNLYLATNVARELSKISFGSGELSINSLEMVITEHAERVVASGVKQFQSLDDIRVDVRCPSDENYPSYLVHNLQVPFVEVECRVKTPCLLCWDSNFRRELKSKSTLALTSLPVENVLDCE